MPIVALSLTIISTQTNTLLKENIMTNLNTQANRTAILDRIEKDGVSLKEFSVEQKKEIINVYTAVCLNESLIK